MNAYMNISVRVLSAQAQAQIKALQAQVAQLEGQLAKANAVSSGPGAIGGVRSRKTMAAWGNQIQWTGRQLQYNWTLPLLLAGAAATKFELDNQKAFVRVQKVYGDTQDAAAQFNKEAGKSEDAMYGQTKAAQVFKNELNALDDAFVALSNRYGVNQAQVLETAGAWAAAGSSGLALARSTQLSIKASLLGDMDLAKATEALISIQSQYSLSTKELNLTLAELNAIENQTGISMQGLIDGFTRAAGAARESGVDVRHLGAMLAALVPATGSAATAGNALKTIISRIMSPTKDAAEVMNAFGVSTKDAVWQSSTAMERLEVLADHMNGTLRKTADGGYQLSDSQKQVVASVLGSRYQMNRFLVLMRELGPAQSYYEKALNATEDRTKAFAQAHKELNAILESNPQKLKIMWTVLQNGLADAIQPLIPYLVYLASLIARAVTWFSNLDPAVQKLALAFLVMLAAVGPIVKYFGSLMTLIGTVIMPIKMLIGWWVALTTTTELVNGALITTRLSFIGLFSTMLKAPFKWVANGFMAIYGAIVSVTRGIMGLSIVSTFFSGLGASMSAGFAAAITVAGRVAVVMWGRLWATMAMIQMLGLTRMVKTWAASLILMSRGAMFSPLLGSFTLILAAMSTALKVWVARTIALFASLRGISLGLSVAMSVGWQVMLGASFAAYQAIAWGWTAMWVSLREIMISGQIAIAGAMTFLRTTFLAGWTGIYIGMIAISTAGQRALVTAQAGFMAVWTAVTAVGARAGAAVWAAMHAGMAVISMAFWRNLIRLWIVGAVRLPAIMTLVRTALVRAWVMIGAVMSSGAIASAAAAVGPYVAAAAVIIGVMYAFRDQMKTAWSNTVAYFSDSSNQMTQLVLKAWNALPQGVANALTAVARIVHDAAMQIYEWFSYINPFAHHSPSLVENVQRGAVAVGDGFRDMRNRIRGHIMGAYADLQKFGKAARGIMGRAQNVEQRETRKKIEKFAPGALGEYDKLSKRLRQLQGDYKRLGAVIDAQEKVVNRAQRAVDQMNKKLDKQQQKLERLQAVQQKWQDKLDEASDRLQYFASAPIKGMGEMEDKIFANEMAQKKLRLEMMKMEDAVGTMDELKGKIDAINGAQELLAGTQAGLRAAGAGSEILGAYDDQISKLDDQKDAYESNYDALLQMQKALDDLGRKAEELDLVKSLKFDELLRQIEQAANGMKELSFDEIMAGIKDAQADIGLYTEKLDEATQAVADQQAVVDALTIARDALQASLDAEQAKLDRLNATYYKLGDAISAIEDALQGVVSAADTLQQKLDEVAKKKKDLQGDTPSPALQNFLDAAGGNFADIGGEGIPMRMDWSDQSAEIEKFTQDMADQAAKAFDDINPFNSLKDKWGQFKGWLSNAWDQTVAAGKDMFSHIFDGIGDSGTLTKTADGFRIAWAKTADWFSNNVIDPLKAAWRLLGPTIIDIGKNIWKGFIKIWDQIGPELAKFGDLIAPLGHALQNMWKIAKPILALLAGAILLIIEVVLEMVSKAIGPALEMIGGLLKGTIKIIRGFIEMIVGLFTGDLGMMKQGVIDIFTGMFDQVWAVIKGAVKIIGGLIWGLVKGIYDFFVWLWDELVGHSIVPDIIDGIVFWFGKLADLAKWVWNNVLLPVYNFFLDAWDLVDEALGLWWDGVKAALDGLLSLGKWFFDNVLKPVYDKVKEIWKDYVKPALALWWEGFKTAWNGLLNAAQWFWNNILKPVFDKVKEIWAENIKPALALWWEGFKTAWNALTGAAMWFWNNVLKPVFDKVKAIWTDSIKPEIAEWRTRFENVWNNLTGLAMWIKNNVMDPVVSKIKEGWNDVKDWMVKSKDLLTKPAKTMVGVVIDAVNLLIKGLNKVADILPGFDWHIDPIQLAAGGVIPAYARGGELARRHVGAGFKTNGARAVVGEGKRNHPEYVIPTDPTHRARAASLLRDAASRMGMVAMSVNPRGAGGDTTKDAARLIASGYAEYGAPKYGIGGIIGGIGDVIGDTWDGITGLPGDVTKYLADHLDDAVSFILTPARAAANQLLDTVEWDYPRDLAKSFVSNVGSWGEVADKGIKQEASDFVIGGANAQAALAWARTQVGKPYVWGGVGPDGYDCSGFMSAITNVLRGKQPFSRVGATSSFPWAGFSPGVGAFTIGSTPNYGGSGIGHMAGTLAGVNVESRGGTGVLVGPSARGYNDGGFSTIAHLTKAANGAIVRASSQGSLILAGEGGRDEAVTPLPLGWRDGFTGKGGGDAGTTINLYGNLEFPNITNADDAEEFIENLKALMED